MFDKIDVVWVAIIAFFVTFISVMGKIVSTDLYPEKTMKAKIFIASSKALLGFLLALLVVRGIPLKYPELEGSEFLTYGAWLIAYFAVDLAPIAIEWAKGKVGIKNA